MNHDAVRELLRGPIADSRQRRVIEDLLAENERLRAELDEAQLRSIEARNPSRARGEHR